MLTKTEAEEKGTALLKMMDGTGWKLEVWKHLGWNFYVCNKNLTVRQEEQGYTVHLGHSEGQDSPGYWRASRYFKDPNEAVEYQMKSARNFVADVSKTVRALDGIIPEYVEGSE